jgi:hypothetical protein
MCSAEISYARAGGTEYTESLAQELIRFVSLWVDLKGTRPGKQPGWRVELAVMLSRVFVVLNSPGAAMSVHVAREVRTFARWGSGIVIPVELGSPLETALWCWAEALDSASDACIRPVSGGLRRRHQEARPWGIPQIAHEE